MVTSATYRQSAVATPEKLEKDADNRLLSRGPRFRMHGEMIRDLALAASGLLSPSTWAARASSRTSRPASGRSWRWKRATRRSTCPTRARRTHRRSLYTFWKRAAPPPAMETFNAPTREQCAVRPRADEHPAAGAGDPERRPVRRGVAPSRGGRHRERGRTTRERLDAIALRVLARPLETARADALRPVVRDLRDHYAGDAKASRALVAVGDSSRDRVDPRPGAGRVDHGGEPVPQSGRGPEQMTRNDHVACCSAGDDRTMTPPRSSWPGAGRGIGSVALALDARRLGALRRRHRRAADPAALPPEGAARHLALPGRRAVAARYLGLQAEATRDVRQGPAGIGPRQPAPDRHDLRPEALPGRAQPLPVRPVRAERRPG